MMRLITRSLYNIGPVTVRRDNSSYKNSTPGSNTTKIIKSGEKNYSYTQNRLNLKEMKGYMTVHAS